MRTDTKLAGLALAIVFPFMVLVVGCERKSGTMHPQSDTAEPVPALQKRIQRRVLDVTSPSGVPCVVIAYSSAVAISCNWNDKAEKK